MFNDRKSKVLLSEPEPQKEAAKWSEKSHNMEYEVNYQTFLKTFLYIHLKEIDLLGKDKNTKKNADEKSLSDVKHEPLDKPT